MPILLLRQNSTTSLSTIVEKSQRQQCQPHYEYDLQVISYHLELLLLSRPSTATESTAAKITNSNSDEGFESDIDSISLISSENESFTSDKTVLPESVKSILTETDSANGGSGSDSETDNEKTNTLTQKNVNAIKETFEKQSSLHNATATTKESYSILDCEKQSTLNNPTPKTKESYSILDVVCYADVSYPDILIFVIKNEAFVFKFEDLRELKTFYTNFSTLKAVANQRAYSINNNKNLGKQFNLLQRTDNDGVTHIEVKRSQESQGSSRPEEPLKNDVSTAKESPKCRQKDVNLRQRAESKLLINDVKFNTVSSKVNTKKSLVRANSIENILNVDGSSGNNLVKDVEGGSVLRKVWNSAEDLLACNIPKRPERRKKKKPAPPPPQKPQEDVFSGQFVRVNVNFEALKDNNQGRLVIKSSANEPHPKKLQKSSVLASFLKPQPKLLPPETLKYTKEEALNNKHGGNDVTFTKLYEKNNSWTSSVPRLLKKSCRSKSETRNGANFQPMAYRYIDATHDYTGAAYPAAQNNALFLSTTGLKPSAKVQNMENLYRSNNIKSSPEISRINFGYKDLGTSSIGNRLFGLSPKLKDFSSCSIEGNNNYIVNNNNNNASNYVNNNNNNNRGKWGSMSELNFFCSDKDKCNLKSVIKNSGEMTGGKKKNDKREKKVTFSAYTTVQVV